MTPGGIKIKNFDNSRTIAGAEIRIFYVYPDIVVYIAAGAFDLYFRGDEGFAEVDTIAGNQILVRRAEKNEKFVTLDGQERTMDDSVLMICDGEKAIGIAGIMGGENSNRQDPGL